MLEFIFHGTGNIGIDEVGRGPLAGPLVAAAVCIESPEEIWEGVKESKKLSPVKREYWTQIIKEQVSAYCIIEKSAAYIDEVGIGLANKLAFEQLLSWASLSLPESYCIIDGNLKLNTTIEHLTIPKADDRYLAVALASILAKTYHDQIMADLDTQYPQYGWKTNQGYGSKQHLEALSVYGLSPYHRRSFCTKIKLPLIDELS